MKLTSFFSKKDGRSTGEPKPRRLPNLKDGYNPTPSGKTPPPPPAPPPPPPKK